MTDLHRPHPGLQPRHGRLRGPDGARRRAGFRKGARRSPGPIVLDIMMPKLDGYETAKALEGRRDHEAHSGDLLSAKGRKRGTRGGLRVGRRGIIKPFSPRKLVERINAIGSGLRPAAHTGGRTRVLGIHQRVRAASERGRGARGVWAGVGPTPRFPWPHCAPGPAATHAAPGRRAPPDSTIMSPSPSSPSRLPPPAIHPTACRRLDGAAVPARPSNSSSTGACAGDRRTHETTS